MSELTDEEWNNHLSLLWANKHLNGVTWDELLDLHLARYASRWVDLPGLVNKILDLHRSVECDCEGASIGACDPPWCGACMRTWPCDTVKAIDEIR